MKNKSGMDWEDVDVLKRELDEARKETHVHTRPLMEMVAAYHANAWADNAVSGADEPENVAFMYVASVSADLIHSAPEIRVTTQRTEADMQLTATALRHFGNRWGKESRLAVDLRAGVPEFLMSHTGFLVQQVANDSLDSMERIPEDIRKELRGGRKKPTYNPKASKSWASGVYGDESPLDEMRPMVPRVTKLDPKRWGWDPAATRFEDARYYYHEFCRDRGRLIKHAEANPDEGWDVEAIRDMPTGEDTVGMGYASSRVPQRDDVVMAEMWIPEYRCDEAMKPEDGYHGSIVTLAVTTSPGQASTDTRRVRKDRPYYGHPRGPFVLGGVYPVPGSAWPLGPLSANHAQIDDLNDLERGNTQSAKDYKRIQGVPAENAKAASLIQRTLHDSMVALPGLDPNKLYPIEVGGVTQQMLLQAQYMRDRLQRNLGLSEVQAGRAQGGVTATADALADQATDKRLVTVVQRWEQMVGDIYERVLWYPFHSEDVVYPLSQEASEELGAGGQPIWIEGGNEGKDKGFSFADLEIQVQVGSMRQKTEEVMRQEHTTLLSMTLQMLPTMAQAPDSDWATILDELGALYGEKEWSIRWRVEALAGQPIDPGREGSSRFGVDAIGSDGAGPRTINITGGAGGGQQPAGIGAPSSQAQGAPSLNAAV